MNDVELIQLKLRPLPERAARQIALTYEGSETMRIAAAMTFATLTGPELLAEVIRLRTALAKSRMPHAKNECSTNWDHAHPLAERGCTCGAAEHNARIDALLKEDNGPTAPEAPHA